MAADGRGLLLPRAADEGGIGTCNVGGRRIDFFVAAAALAGKVGFRSSWTPRSNPTSRPATKLLQLAPIVHHLESVNFRSLHIAGMQLVTNSTTWAEPTNLEWTHNSPPLKCKFESARWSAMSESITKNQ